MFRLLLFLGQEMDLSDANVCAMICNPDALDDSSSESGYYTDLDELDYDLSNDYNFTNEPEDYYLLRKLDAPHGKTAKDQTRREQKMESTKFMKSLNLKEFNTWQKNKKNKSIKANKKWQFCEISQIVNTNNSLPRLILRNRNKIESHFVFSSFCYCFSKKKTPHEL